MIICEFEGLTKNLSHFKGQAHTLQAIVNDRLSAGTELPEEAVEEVRSMLSALAQSMLTECNEMGTTLDELGENEVFDS